MATRRKKKVRNSRPVKAYKKRLQNAEDRAVKQQTQIGDATIAKARYKNKKKVAKAEYKVARAKAYDAKPKRVSKLEGKTEKQKSKAPRRTARAKAGKEARVGYAKNNTKTQVAVNDAINTGKIAYGVGSAAVAYKERKKFAKKARSKYAHGYQKQLGTGKKPGTDMVLRARPAAKGLSRNKKIGIGVGVGVAAGGAAYAYKRRKQQTTYKRRLKNGKVITVRKGRRK